MRSKDSWVYFRMLEDRVSTVSRYVYVEKENYSSYSSEIANIIISACVEIEDLMGSICTHFDQQLKRKKQRNISERREVIDLHHPWLFDFKVFNALTTDTLSPWEGWSLESSPDWWKNGYNKLKHDRYVSRMQANIGNMLSCMAGLLAIILCYERTFNNAIARNGCVRVIVGKHDCPRLFYPIGGFEELVYKNEHGACFAYDFK